MGPVQCYPSLFLEHNSSQLLSCFLPIATDSSANSNSHSYISNLIIIEQLSMRNNHNMWQRHMAAQIIISGMFCMNGSLQDQTPTTAVVSVHNMIDFSKFVSFNSLPWDDYNDENDICFHY